MNSKGKTVEQYQTGFAQIHQKMFTSLIKLKCGGSLEDDKRRLRLAREAVGPNIKISIDANQVWDVDQAIEWIKKIGDVNLHWVEEPTNPDDVLGHAAIAKAIAPVRVATGEHGMNRIIFKQMLQAKSFSFMQIDATRVAGVNENLANILMAAKFQIPVCPHAGGVGLCELVQHLAMFDAVVGVMPRVVCRFGVGLCCGIHLHNTLRVSHGIQVY